MTEAVDKSADSHLHFLHVMWLQPPFFSIVELHLAHSLVLAINQFDVSESSAHFFSQSLTYLQISGR